MGRSVNYLTSAQEKTFFTTADEEDEDLAQFYWDDLIANIQGTFEKRFPSLFADDEWDDGNETRIILKNIFAEIGISEYCGTASLSIRVNPSYYDIAPGHLAENWIKLVWPKMERLLHDKLGLDVYH